MSPIRNIDFSESDAILHYRPVIEYVEPQQQPGEYGGSEEAPTTIEEARKEVEDVIKGYKAVEDLAKVSQNKVDQRVRAAGGVEMQLDRVKDNILIAAIKRQFPKEDGTRITYDMYKECLRRMNEASPDVPRVQGGDIQEALKNPLRTNFGGSENPAGANRPEIYTPVDFVEPVDLDQFKESMLVQLAKTVLDIVNPF